MIEQSSHSAGSERDDATAERIMDALGALVEVFGPHMQACAANIGLAAPYAVALRRIDGSTPMKDLAQRMHCDPSFVTAIADALEERGFATRRADPKDRRIKNLVLTREGIKAQARFRRDLFTDPPGIRRLDAHEREALVTLLTRMVRSEADVEDQPSGLP